MTHVRLTTAAIFLILFCALAKPVEAQRFILYDNFDTRFIDPQRWNTYSACYSSNGLEMECVREIQTGRLRLAHRTFGATYTDVGSENGETSLTFTNQSVKSITTDLRIRAIREDSCAANPQYLGGRAHIEAKFFNTGSSDPNDDVGVQFVFGRSFSDPAGEISVYSQIFQGSNYIGFIPLGTFFIGTPISATVIWDQPNHQFLASWTNLITGAKLQTAMPYDFSDTTPATNPTKKLSVVTFAANCTATLDSVYVEATFDNVRISK